MSREPLPRAVLGTGAYGEFEGAPDDQVVFGTYLRTGVWSPGLVALLAELLGGASGNGTLIDVGAHIGLVAIAAIERTAGARCLAFEPAPRNFELLRCNVQRHRLDARIETHALALDMRSGNSELALSADNSGDHHLVGREARDTGVVGRHSVGVRTARFDEVLAGRALPHPWVVKLDCQGAEARVLRGAGALLAEIDHMVVEWWPAGLLRMGDSAEALHDLLAALPYATLIDQRTGPGQMQDSRVFLDSLSWIPTDGSDPGFFDLLLSRSPRINVAGRETLAPR
jgi:FkbM family methyltransferase